MFDELKIEKMPGHWLLARMGKRVLRPGGVELTNQMMESLKVSPQDRVVEFAPGMGHTARKLLARQPKEYFAIDQSEEAVQQVRSMVNGQAKNIVQSSITSSGLPAQLADVVAAEAVLTMQTDKCKQDIINEAFRLLKPGGRFGTHEIALAPDELAPALKDQIRKDLSGEIHVNARPLTAQEWTSMYEQAGFRVEKVMTNPMHLLRFRRLLNDEGFGGTLRIAFNVLTTPKALTRVKGMRAVFEKYQQHMAAISIIAVKPQENV